jgi:hypothetical protein
MASATAPGAISDGDITTCFTIVPRNVLARLRATAPKDESQWVAEEAVTINNRIDNDLLLSEQQKRDLKNLIKLSPNMAHTLAILTGPATEIFDLHLVCSAGFQFFIDGGRGKGGNGSQVGQFLATLKGMHKLTYPRHRVLRHSNSNDPHAPLPRRLLVGVQPHIPCLPPRDQARKPHP